MPLPFVAVGDDGEVVCFEQDCDEPGTGKNLNAAARIGSLFAKAARFIVVGDDGTIFRREAGAWEKLKSGTTKHLNGISIAPPVRSQISKTGWIVGDDGLILKTVDGGGNWGVQVSNTTVDLKGVCAVSSKAVWAVGDGGAILKTTNGGGFWDVLDSGTGRGLKAISAIDLHLATAVGDAVEILTTVDGGSHWIGSGAVLLPTVHAVVMRKAFTVVTLDDGEVWFRGSDPTAGFFGGGPTGSSKSLNGLRVNEKNGEVLVVGDDGAILFSEDMGQTWQTFASDTSKTLHAVI